MFSRREWLGAAVAAGASAQMAPVREEFASRNPFEIREVVDSTADRTGNWAVKHAELPGGKLVMVWCSTSGSEVSKTNRLWISESRDDAATWSAPRTFLQSREGESVLNPALFTGSDGTLLLFHNSGDAKRRFDLVIRRSKDGGTTWSGPEIIPFDDTVVSSVMSNPIRLRNGVIALPICFSRPARRNNHYLSTVLLSRDGGRGWTHGGEIQVEAERGAMEPALVELPNGELYCLMRTKAGFQYESRSRDGGMTWSVARPSPFAGPESTGILLRLRSGGILFAWNGNGMSGGKQVPRFPMTIAMSRDGGKSWPWRRVIETTFGERQLSNHGLFETSSGRIVLAMNHFQGIREGREYGPVLQARFSESWLLESVAADRWEESPAPTGAIRVEPGGVTLVSGGAADGVTRLVSRKPLPASGSLSVHVTGTPAKGTGIYFGSTPADGKTAPLTAGEQRIPIPQAGPWGFFARYEDGQSRVTIRAVRSV